MEPIGSIGARAYENATVRQTIGLIECKYSSSPPFDLTNLKTKIMFTSITRIIGARTVLAIPKRLSKYDNRM